MATIITVHGTGATGPEEGDAWWQKGSEFEKSICDLVEGKDGALTFRRLIWDGANSERARRHAGARLLTLLNQADDRGERYCIVGHSHGGSIILWALALSAFRSRPLSSLNRWITVGTPFTASKRAALLFFRIGIFVKAAYVCFFSYFVLLSSHLILHIDAENVGNTLLVLGALNSPFLLLHLVIWTINRKYLFIYRAKTAERLKRWFAPRRLTLWHKDDEAIQLLSSLKNVKVALFQADFFLPVSAFTSILVIPAFLFCAVTFGWSFEVPAPTQRGPAGDVTYPAQFGGERRTVKIDFPVIAERITSAIAETYSSKTPTMSLLTFLVIIPAMLFIASIIITIMIVVLATYVGVIVSIMLNWVTMKQLQYSAFGNDTDGETIYNASPLPALADSLDPPLPAMLADEMSGISDKYATITLSKFRSEFGKVITSRPPSSEIVQDYLNWKELIHTCYFAIPRFQLLLAYAIAHSEGFGPSATFKKHPDYELVARWYEEIQPKKEIVPVSPVPMPVREAKKDAQ